MTTAVVLVVGVLFTLMARAKHISDTSLPCIYEGRLKTEKDWFGFLANVTIMSTGRMTFQFRYAADRCCQNVLFYLDDQVSILNSRMNCWQKEALLRPEDDQVLRLTPRFTYSGCHMTHPAGVATYVCEGGRSFTNSLQDKPTTWYIAVCNCATLGGLELHYRLEVIGHIGECKNGYRILTTTTSPVTPAQNVAVGGSGEPERKQTSDKGCVIRGDLNVSDTWHGYLANVSLKDAGGFKFRFSYPAVKQIQNVLLYNEEDINKLREQQSCWQKEGVISSRHVPDQILDLHSRSSWNGCFNQHNTGGSLTLVCEGTRRFDRARKLYVAVSNCRSQGGLALKYRFEFFGFEGNPCGGASNIFGFFASARRTMDTLVFYTSVIMLTNYLVQFQLR